MNGLLHSFHTITRSGRKLLQAKVPGRIDRISIILQFGFAVRMFVRDLLRHLQTDWHHGDGKCYTNSV